MMQRFQTRSLEPDAFCWWNLYENPVIKAHSCWDHLPNASIKYTAVLMQIFLIIPWKWILLWHQKCKAAADSVLATIKMDTIQIAVGNGLLYNSAGEALLSRLSDSRQ